VSAPREGSIRSQVLEVLGPATSEMGRGLVATEVCELVSSRNGRPVSRRSVASSLSALCAKGLVIKTGGRLKKTRWALAGFEGESADTPDPARKLVQVLTRLATSQGRAVTTSEVSAAWEDSDGPSLDMEQIRMMLINLANDTPTKRANACPEWQTPRVTKFSEKTPTGQTRVFWAPPGSSLRPPRFLSAVDAALEAVTQAESHLGRPVSLPESTLWLRAAAAGEFGPDGLEVVRALEGYRFKAGIRSLAHRFRSGKQGPARQALREIPPWMLAKNTYHARFTTQNPDPAMDSAARLEDGITLLRPAEEKAAIDRLRDEAGVLGCPIRERIAETRLSLLIRELRRFAPEEPSDMAIACRACARARGPLKRWYSYAGMKPWAERLEVERLEDEARTFEAAEALLLTTASMGLSVGIKAVSDVIGAPRTHFDPMIEEAARLVGSPSSHHHARILDARRIQSRPPGTPMPKGSGKYFRDVGIDRPDAISLIARQAPLSGLTAWVASGHELLGLILRDPDWISSILEALPSPGHDLRPGLVAALGLLGSVPPLELACPLSYDHEAMSSYLWAVALGEDCPERRIELAEQADLYADGSTRDVTETALGRLEQGHRLQVLG
jgi:hypothetical protein